MKYVIEFAPLVFSVIAIVISLWNNRSFHKRARFNIMEEMGDSLQRINEKALESDKNLEAAMRSDETWDFIKDKNEARAVYFNYMRINRIFRAYEYNRGGFITKNQLSKIVQPHKAILMQASLRLGPVLFRKYDTKFIEFLVTEGVMNKGKLSGEFRADKITSIDKLLKIIGNEGLSSEEKLAAIKRIVKIQNEDVNQHAKKKVDR